MKLEVFLNTILIKFKSLLKNILIITVLFFVQILPALGATTEDTSLKKVLILDFINISKNPDFEYLENTITDSITETLKKKFAFLETPHSDWESVAIQNFFSKDEYYTKSASMNIGLLSKQDLVISGGFTVRDEKTGSVIVISAKFFDMSSKKIIADLSLEGPASSEIFQTIEDMVNRIAEEAGKILPNREDWKQKALETIVYAPLFSNFQVGINAGGGLFFGGWNSEFKTNLPMLSAVIRAEISRISFLPLVQFEFDYFSHSFAPETTSPLYKMGLELSSQNLLFGLYLGKNFRVSEKISLTPLIGGGLLYQITDISGFYAASTYNSMFFAAALAEGSYWLNSSMAINLFLKSTFLFEEKLFTVMGSAGAGVIFKF